MEVDRTIKATEMDELLSQYEPFDTKATFDAKGITLDLKNYDVKIVMESVRKDPEVSVDTTTGEGMATMSRFYVEKEDEVIEVETEGPFDIGIPGIGDVL